LYNNKEVSSYITMQEMDRNSLRSVLQLYVNNGLQILCKKIA